MSMWYVMFSFLLIIFDVFILVVVEKVRYLILILMYMNTGEKAIDLEENKFVEEKESATWIEGFGFQKTFHNQ